VTVSLVTGGNGYFGRHLVRRLSERDDTVRILDVDVTGSAELAVEVIHGDVRDADAVRRAVTGVDVVYHNVAQVPLARDRRLLRAVNV
jgi:nucleoside-diphosphate-sugar epimerase